MTQATADELLALAERVEQATGPDRELDAGIARAVEWRPKGLTASEKYPPWWFSDAFGMPAYTRSLDAAMSLVPEGWRVSGLFQRNCKLPNWIWKAEIWSPEADENVRGIARNADVPALAMTAAALRARAHSQEVK